MNRTRLAFGSLCAIFALAAGCQQILSIDDAELDPTLDASAGTGGSAGKGGTAGNAGTAGSAGNGGTAGTSGSGGSAGTAGDSGADVETGPLCERYCNAIMAGCTGEYAQYANNDACLATCATLPPGTPEDDTGNSQECRYTFAKFAASGVEPDFNCPIAGPSGGKKCGTPCEATCTIIQAVCVGDNPHYTSQDDCLADCSRLPEKPSTPLYRSSNEFYTEYSGPWWQCRLLHATNSAISPLAADSHCSHAMGDTPCEQPDGG